MKIAVAGTGYVGLSIATLLSQNHEVVAVDVIPEKVEKINKRISPIQDEYIEKYFAEKELNLTATLDAATAYKDAEFIVIAAPTNYDPQKNFFDTHHIEDVINIILSVNPDAVMVIKSIARATPTPARAMPVPLVLLCLSAARVSLTPLYILRFSAMISGAISATFS